MKDPIKITPEETKSITDLQTEVQKSTVNFGSLYIEKIQVDSLIKVIAERESVLQEEWKKLQAKENELVQSFYKKYGNGSLDIKQGLFIPNE